MENDIGKAKLHFVVQSLLAKMTTFMNVFVRSSQNFCGEWSKTYTFEHELPVEWPSKANLLSISYFKSFLKLKIKFGPVKMFERAKLYQIGVENC